MNKLSPPSTKTPLIEGSKETLNHIWQRWFSDLYENVKSGTAGTTIAGSAQGPQGPSGPAGPGGSAGPVGPEGPVKDILADGGFANSVYLPEQTIDGGGA